MKLNKLVFAILIGVIALSSKCKDDTPPIYEISYENEAERYAKDLDSIEHFLDIHYVNDLGDMDPATYRFDSIPTGGTQTSLRDDPRLAYFMVDQDADHDGVRQDYKVYYLKFREGVGQRPTYVDSIYNTYTGIIVSGDNAEEEFDSRATPLWASLPSLIRAWDYALPQIKAGTHTVNTDGTVDYNDYGVMAFFAPSGIAYFQFDSGSIPAYTPIYFKINLMAVKTDVDHDGDGILTIYEDVNGNGDVRDDNTDSNIERSDRRLPNYIDNDDDNDGHRTIDEGSDPNGDGNPDDAEDLDNDGIPNYLDNDSH